jgi:hypothetical protein
MATPAKHEACRKEKAARMSGASRSEQLRPPLGWSSPLICSRRACSYAFANKGHDTWAIQGWLGYRSITSTAIYAALAPNQFKDFWEGQDGGGGRMGRKTREDDSTKDFKKAVKDSGKPSKKEKRRRKR